VSPSENLDKVEFAGLLEDPVEIASKSIFANFME